MTSNDANAADRKKPAPADWPRSTNKTRIEGLKNELSPAVSCSSIQDAGGTTASETRKELVSSETEIENDRTADYVGICLEVILSDFRCGNGRETIMGIPVRWWNRVDLKVLDRGGLKSSEA